MKIFRDQIVVLKNDAQVQLELDFKIARLKRWTCEQSWELHVNRNLNFRRNISVGNLKILNFGRIAWESFSTSTRFDSHQLNFDAFQRHFSVLNGYDASERFCNVARSCVDAAGDEKSRNVNFLFRGLLKCFWADAEMNWHLRFNLLGLKE